jgi:transmembrane sensor
MTRPGRNAQCVDPRDEAIAWLAREREGRLPSDQQAVLQAWLDADPTHADLYARARAAVEAPARFAAHPDLMDMRAAALATLKERPQYPRMIAAAAAVVVAVTTLGAGWVTLAPSTSPRVSRLQEVAAPILPALNPNAALYRTAVGERTSVTLPDGSVAVLNTNTVLKVAYTGRERGVRLVRGQALFEVAHNKRVPFQVYAGDRRVTAVGTVFDVRLDAKRVKVTLVEGVVRVATLAPKQPAAPAQQVTMTAGEELQAGPATMMSVKPADVAAETSWKAGVVVFKAETLAQAAAEVNRYTDRPVRLADASIADYRITGVFKTGDPEHFAKGVAEILPVRVEPQADGSMVLTAK